jgi:cell wall-associated NlpC family hydrolase
MILYHASCIYKPSGNNILTLWILLAVLLFSGCSSAPKAPTDNIAGARIISQSQPKVTSTRTIKQRQPAESKHALIEIAEGLRGKPYRYGGVTPKGFDCSGFVHYAYDKAGLSIPRTTGEQYQMAQRLSINEARPGDLLFFRINSRKLKHVGLYVGKGRFLHASTSKKRVAEASLEDPYWDKRLLGVGRIHDIQL